MFHVSIQNRAARKVANSFPPHSSLLLPLHPLGQPATTHKLSPRCQFLKSHCPSVPKCAIPLARFDNIGSCIEDVLRNGVPGDLIETGVWRGGAAILTRGVLKSRGVTDRSVWVADSFEGLPEPDPDKFPLEAKAQSGPVMQKAHHNLAVGLEEVKRNFAAYSLLDDQVRFLKGWFKDTLPTAPWALFR